MRVRLHSHTLYARVEVVEKLRDQPRAAPGDVHCSCVCSAVLQAGELDCAVRRCGLPAAARCQAPGAESPGAAPCSV